MILVGRLQSIEKQMLCFAGDLAESLALGDAAYVGFLNRVDAYIEQHGMNLPPEPDAHLIHRDPPCVTAPVRQLDTKSIDLGSLIWATGYTHDFSWIDLPVLDARGTPIHDRGIAPLPGIYFLGLPWLSRMNSSFLSGVGDDAARLADIIQSRSDVVGHAITPVREVEHEAGSLTSDLADCGGDALLRRQLARMPNGAGSRVYRRGYVYDLAGAFSRDNARRRPVCFRAGSFLGLLMVNLRSTMALLGYLIFFSFAYVRLDAGSGALVLIGAVQITMFGIALHEGERFRPSQWTGLGLALFGFIFLILPGVSAPDPFGAVLMFLSGYFMGVFFAIRPRST